MQMLSHSNGRVTIVRGLHGNNAIRLHNHNKNKSLPNQSCKSTSNKGLCQTLVSDVILLWQYCSFKMAKLL